MKFGSICSGIEAASVAWEPLGFKPAFFSEIEKFPCNLLKHHYPHVPNRGDMTKFKDWPDDTIDLLVGGTPCQSFSVAGLRKGLSDPRGNLALTFLAIAQRYQPRWVVWENVPGVLSSNKGRDFGAFIGGLAKLGYGWAYRVLDAQYCRVDGFPWAVPQSRRRVFVVGYLGDARCAAAVLFDAKSLRRHPAPSRETGQDTADASGTSAEKRYIGGFDKECNAHGMNEATGPLLKDNPTGGGKPLPAVAMQVSHEIAPTLTARECKGPLPEANLSAVAFSSKDYAVRRLTPTECERLQGFPDGYTLVPHTHGKPAADGPRYKALGNSMAVNVMRVLGARIRLVDEILGDVTT